MEKLKFISGKINLSSKIFLFSICGIIFALSLYLRSIVDVGGDTVFYIDLGEKITNGKKYYYDFFESNFPLSFYFYSLQFYFSKFLHINPLITSEIFINILAIISIFSSYKILSKDPFYKKREDYKNLLIISFALSFFLRITSLYIGEFGTKTSLLLILIFPYISFCLIDKKYLTKLNLTWRGILMGLAVCLKPHYAILIMIVEIYNLFRTKSLKFFLELDKIVAIFIIILYLNLMLIFTTEFFEFMVPMWSEFYSVYSDKKEFFENIAKHFNNKFLLLSLIFPMFLHQKLSQEDKILLLFFLSSCLLLSIENIGTTDQEAIFYSFTTICILKFSYDFFSSEKFLFNNNKFIVLFLAILPLFDSDNFFALFFNLINIWWLIAASCLVYLYKTSSCTKKEIRNISVITIILSAISIFFLVKFGLKTSSLINIIFFAVFLFLFEKKYAKYYKKFSILLTIIVISINSYIACLYISSIKKTITKEDEFSLPNKLTDMINFYVNRHAKNDKESYLVLSNWIVHTYPLITYLQKENYFKYATPIIYDHLERNEKKETHTIFSVKNRERAFTYSYLMDDLKKQLKNENIKILFVNNGAKTLSRKARCNIGILEYYFMDPEFKKLFFENFRFENHFLAYKKWDNILRINTDKYRKLERSKKVISYDFEIYIRK